MRKYICGIYYPVIGYLMKEKSVELSKLKEYYIGVAANKIREKTFEKWIENLQDDGIISIEYGIVTFNEEQWKLITREE